MNELRKTALVAAMALVGGIATWKGSAWVTRHDVGVEFLNGQLEFIEGHLSKYPDDRLLLEVDIACWHFVGDDDVETIASCGPRAFAGPPDTVLREVERYDRCVDSGGLGCGPARVVVEDARSYAANVELARAWHHTRRTVSFAVLLGGVILLLIGLVATPVMARRTWRGVQRRRASTIRTRDVLEPLQRTQELRDADMIDAAEGRRRVDAVLDELNHKVFVGDLDVLLDGLIPLRTSGLLTLEDVQAIKVAISGGEG